MRVNKFVHEYMSKMKQIEENLIEYIENQQETDDNYFYDFVIKNKVKLNKYDLNSFFHLLSCISNHHQRSPCLIKKIETIILNLQSEIENFFTNLEIFHIFEDNKRILLFLFEQGILKQDKNVLTIIQNRHQNYIQYLFPEFKNFNKQEKERFEKYRKIGENDSYICELIRNDNVEEFITYCTKNNYSLKSQIKPSIFETNPFLLGDDTLKMPSLIEYASFFGSIQIVQYLILNNIDLEPSLWNFAIHSNNAELIHLLEYNQCEQNDKIYQMCLIESIKCHHYDLINYYDTNFISNKFYFTKSMKYFNFQYICNHLFKVIKFKYPIDSSNYKCIIINQDDGYFHIPKELIIFISFKYEFIEIANFLINHNEIKINGLFTVNKTQYSLLYIAVKNENYDIIKQLLCCSNIDVNTGSIKERKRNINNNGFFSSILGLPFEKYDVETPLHIAIQKYNIEIVNLLLTKNIDIGINHIKNGSKRTTMKFAFDYKQRDIIKSLLTYVNLDQIIKCYDEKRYSDAIIYVSNYINKNLINTLDF